jgi:nicotinate-nucleotide adenylyltransferase
VSKDNSNQPIGLFGGSFDPVHLGHLLVAQAAREELSLTRLYFIPAAKSPFKPERAPTPAPQRLRLLRLALAARTWCEIDDQEIRRGGLSYTIDTVRDYSRRFPKAQLFYLIGADHAPQLPKWREARELARLVEFVVIPRPQPEGTLVAFGGDTQLSPLSAAEGEAEISGNPLPPSARRTDPVPAPFRGRLLRGFPLGVSSSQIRERVKVGAPIDHLVPAAVAEAIHNNRLYL